MANPPTIPPALTQTSWAKEKGIVAKILKSDTGIGDLIGKVATAYGNVDWTKFNADTALANIATNNDIDAAKTAASTEYKTNVEALRTAVTALRDKAKATAESWKKNKLIPSSSQKAADAINKAAEQFSVALKDNAPYIVEFAKACDQAKKDLVTEKIKPGEKPANWHGPWWTARAPRGIADDKLATKIEFFWAHYDAYPKYVGKNDSKNISNRINCLRQMIAGLDQGEAAIRATITRCKPGIHDNTKAALQHYLTLLPAYRKQRKAWIDKEKIVGQTVPEVAKDLDVRVIKPGLDRL
jgi:hypothetical protein